MPSKKPSKKSAPSSTPLAVLISDVHYNLQTLPLADQAVRAAVKQANALSVPLIIAGDLHDSKANMRAECVNAMLKTLALAEVCYILVGNHCRINEKSVDHALNFLASDKVFIIDKPEYEEVLGLHLIPYQHDPDDLKAYLLGVKPGSTLIMHQGCQGSIMGDYIQDKSAIGVQDVAGMRVVSGHYHTRQSISLPEGGRWDYIGNPYTLTWGEANDPPKGFQVLYSDGSLEFIPTNLRKHVVFNLTAKEAKSAVLVTEPGDLIQVKITGTKEELAALDKAKYQGMRLDLIPLETTTKAPAQATVSQPELLDQLIDSIENSSDEQKARLKELWRNIDDQV